MILAIDTSGILAVVAVADADGVLVAGGVGTAPRAHAEDVAVLVRAAVSGQQVDRVVVGRGPGSFTGLRVGLAFGQMFAWACGVAVSGMCSLDVVAAQFDLVDGWAVTDARRGELFAARYRDRRRIQRPVVLTRDQAGTDVADERVVGDVALLTSTERRQAGDTRLDPAALASAAATAVSIDPEGSLQPEYLRRPDVTMSAANRGGA